jgi:hypothetical protein
MRCCRLVTVNKEMISVSEVTKDTFPGLGLLS